MSSNLLNHIKQYGLEDRVDDILSRIYVIYRTFEDQVRSGVSRAVALTSFYKEVDRIIAEDLAADPVPVSCKKGCGACCNMSVSVNLIEAELLVKYAKEHNIPIDEAYLKRQLEVMPEALPFHSAVSSCIFLTKDKTCGIYDARPFACRKYLVVTPAEKCNIPKYPNFQVRDIIFPRVEEVVSAVDTAAERIGSMPEMLLEVLGQQKQTS